VKERDRYEAVKRLIDFNPQIYGLIFCRTKNETAAVADFVRPYDLRDNPATSTNAGWEVKRYQSGIVKSFMKRIPMHEPWALHENQAPAQLTPENTDRDA
jgi:hypothetical protein